MCMDKSKEIEKLKELFQKNGKDIFVVVALIAILILVVQQGILKDLIIFAIILYFGYLFFFNEAFGCGG